MELHFDRNNLDLLFNYTDDLLVIHRQLTLHLKRTNRPCGVLVLKTDVAMQTLFAQDLLETETHLGKAAKRSKYAVKYVDRINSTFLSAHHAVIKAFYDCWGVLPSRELDDYRLMGSKCLTLSTDFIAEAMASDVAQKEAIPHALTETETYLEHEAMAGHDLHAVYVGSWDNFVAVAIEGYGYWYTVLDEEGERQLDIVPPKWGKHHPEGCFQIGREVFCFAEALALEGAGWGPELKWLSLGEMEALYAQAQAA